MDKAFSTKGLADKWGCSSQHIRNLIKKNELPCFKLGNLVRIPAWAVKQREELPYIEEHGAPSGEKKAERTEPPFVPKTGQRQSEDFKNF
jgi:excisionase family DNA binding protein